jgi:hypothetical protein
MAHATGIYAEHRSFAEQIEAGDPDPRPCACWHAGRGHIRGVAKNQVQHPQAFGEGWLDAYEQANDI